jgi:hypothetical protein
MCDETPSSDNNLGKGRPSPVVPTSEVNLLSLQKYLKVVDRGWRIAIVMQRRSSNVRRTSTYQTTDHLGGPSSRNA